MHFVVQRERVIPLAPVVADARLAVDDQRVHAQLAQPRGDRQAGLAGAHDQHGRIVIGIAARALALVLPVLGAEVAVVVILALRAAGVAGLFMPAQRLQAGEQDPGPHAARAARIGHQPRHPGAGARGGLEIEHQLDHVTPGPVRPARRRACRRDPEGPRADTLDCPAKQCLDGRPAAGGFDPPGCAQQVAPMPVRQQAGRGGGRIPATQRRFEGAQPLACGGLGFQTSGVSSGHGLRSSDIAKTVRAPRQVAWVHRLPTVYSRRSPPPNPAFRSVNLDRGPVRSAR